MSLRDTLVPPTKVPLGVAALVSYVLPPVICYFVVALLAVTPETRAIRLAFWPIVALLAWRAAISLDLSLGRPERAFLNIDLALSMVALVTRTLEWTLAKGPLVRHIRPANSSPSALMDAIDLVSNLRGCGWEWSRGLYIPRETRPANRIAFVCYTLVSALVHASLCGAFHRAALSLAPVGVGSVPGESTIFDDTLPFGVRYLRASIITTIVACAIYTVLQLCYDLCTVLGVVLLRQDTTQWPPAFDAPWRATSLSEFWARRWHQWFRQTFVFLGGYPLSLVLGRTGMVFGAFLSSAVFHQTAMLTLNDRAEFWRMLLGFGMMAPGILAERVFLRITGRRVGGVGGWVWTATWLLVWGNMIVEGFARSGMFGCSSYIDSSLPWRMLVERSVTDFDAWLHTVCARNG